MPDKGGKPEQITLILRLLCGGYLIYLAWGLFKDGAGGLFLAAGAVFALAGAALLVFTLRTMMRREDQEDEPPEPSSDDTDNGKDEII